MRRIKFFYWKIKASKGKAFLWLWESFYTELKVKLYFLVAKNNNIKINHNLEKKLIISLTSYPPRFKKLHLSIFCLLKQNMVADFIVLWVTVEDFKLLPNQVLKLTRNTRFIIKTCEDLGSGKKILPVLEEFPDDFIITADDDLYYPKEWVEQLVCHWNKDHKTVMAHRVHRITYVRKNKPDLYLNWIFDINDQEIKRENFATSGAGVLYPPKSLHIQVTDRKAYIDGCNNQDDIWQYWMVRLNDSFIQKTPWNYHMIGWLGSEDGSLAVKNLGQGKNDTSINRMIKKYGWPN